MRTPFSNSCCIHFNPKMKTPATSLCPKEDWLERFSICEKLSLQVAHEMRMAVGRVGSLDIMKVNLYY